MAVKKKKMAAALAAVNLFLQEEEAAAAYEEKVTLGAANPNEVTPWGHSGRQDMMNMRRLVQMRVFTRF